MSFLNLQQAIGLTETKLMVFDRLISLSKQLNGKITTEQLVELKKGLIAMAQNDEINLLRERLK